MDKEFISKILDLYHSDLDAVDFSNSIGEMCIAYEEHKKLNIGTKDSIAALTDHAKYCRLSKQPGGLCGRADRGFCGKGYDYNDRYFVFNAFTHCMFPEQQQPVELPKDPLEDLIADTYLAIDGINSKESTCDILRDFAERVRAL